MDNSSIVQYENLIRSFVDGQLDAGSFEDSYLRLFKRESSTLPEEVFLALDRLFADVDAYCADPALCDEHNLNEQQLRERARIALSALEWHLAPYRSTG
jgi:hypothetical protein